MTENDYIYVNCAVCGSGNWKTIYSSLQNVSFVTGEITIAVVMCADCGFIFNNPRPSPSLLAAHYKIDSSGDVFRRSDQNSRGGRLTKLRLDFTNRFIPANSGGALLDIGCGNGFFLQSLNLDAWEKNGIDLSPGCGRNIQNHKIKLISGDILGYEPDKKYDIITCFSSFEHFMSPDLVIIKIHNLLNPEGLLIIDVPDTSCPVPGLEEYFTLEHLSHFTKATLEMFLNRNKFEVVCFNEPTEEFKSLLCAAKINDSAAPRQDEHPCGTMWEIIENYKLENQKLKDTIRKRLDAHLSPIKRRNGKIAIYGAGFHNYFLFKLYEFTGMVLFFIDSDPLKWQKYFMGIKIISPEEIRELSVDAIVISSHHFENEIFETISLYNDNKIPVVKLYDELAG
jgi:2-polyprenyl-3-methyl-5-hydroxy-6-metoxy-1,4-benzoquinol methylase